MLVLAFVEVCLSTRTMMANSKSFPNILSRAPFSFVLFEGNGCGECKKILSVMDSITDKFMGKVTMVMINADTSKDVKEKFGINTIPSIGVFSKQKFLHFYSGEWSLNAISEFCESLLSYSITLLNDVFEVIDFQKTKIPTNIVISGEGFFDRAKEISQTFPMSIKVGYIKNTSIADQLGIRVAKINRPIDGFSQYLENIEDQTVSECIGSQIELVKNPESFGISSTGFTLAALIDETDPLHIYEVSALMRNLSSHYSTNLSYQICDFFKCSSVVSQLGVINDRNPLYLLSSKLNSRNRLTLLAHTEPTFLDVKRWLDKIMLGIENKDDKECIPKMLAKNFMKTVLDAKKDIILLMANPGMPKYQESLDTTKKLIELFKQYKTIEFFEFNPKFQLVQGLQIPRFDKPVFSVWAAQPSPQGYNFNAIQPLSGIVKELIKTIKTKIDTSKLLDLDDRL